jgi:hypothetical protein
MKIGLVFFLALFFLAFAGEKYGVYDPQGNRLSTFEAERHELPEKARQIKSSYSGKTVYVSSMQKGKGSKPSSRYRFKTGSYIEAARKETFAICPPDKKTEGIWISEHSVALSKENCLSVQTPDLAGTIDVLFMESSGKTDTIQVMVDQSYIQMGDYSHRIWAPEQVAISAFNKHDPIIYYLSERMRDNMYGQYESRSYSRNLIVDKTKFIVADACRYSKIDSSVSPFNRYMMEDEYKNIKIEESRLPLAIRGDNAWRLANLRSKMEGLDTVYVMVRLKDARNDGKFVNGNGIPISEDKENYKYNSDSDLVLVQDSSAYGYRVPTFEEWFFLMRAGASTRYYWGDEEDSLTVSRYAWLLLSKKNPLICQQFDTYSVCEYPPEQSKIEPLRPVAQLLPNRFGLYDMVGLAQEGCVGGDGLSVFYTPECWFASGGGHGRSFPYSSFRLMRKTPKLHKLEKF